MKALVAAGAALGLLFASAPAEARGCHERSKIVGKQRCSRFGSGWDVSDVPPFVFSIGPSVSRFNVRSLTFDNTVATRSGGVGLAASGRTLAPFTSVAATVRLTFFLPKIFYLASEGTLGGAVTPQSETVPTAGNTAQPAFTLKPSDADVHTLGIAAGASVPLWRFDFSGEVLGGFRWVSPNFDWKSAAAASQAGGGCWLVPGGKGQTECPYADTSWAHAARVEPRGGLAFHLTPLVSLKALAGVDLLNRGSWTATGLLEIHTRVHDAFFGRRKTLPD